VCILLIIENIPGMPHLKIVWFIFYDLYGMYVIDCIGWLRTERSVVLEHAGTRRHACIDFNDDTRHVRPLDGVIQLRGTLATSLFAFRLVVLLFEARI
jgi:hypothetical protein